MDEECGPIPVKEVEAIKEGYWFRRLRGDAKPAPDHQDDHTDPELAKSRDAFLAMLAEPVTNDEGNWE